MPGVNLIVGNDGSNNLAGTAGNDLIYGFDPNGPQGTVSSITATRVASGLSQTLFATAVPDATISAGLKPTGTSSRDNLSTPSSLCHVHQSLATAHDSLSGNDALIASRDETLRQTRRAGLHCALHHPVGGGEPVFHEARLGPCDQGMRRKGFEVCRDLRWAEFVLLVPAARRGRRQAVGAGVRRHISPFIREDRPSATG